MWTHGRPKWGTVLSSSNHHISAPCCKVSTRTLHTVLTVNTMSMLHYHGLCLKAMQGTNMTKRIHVAPHKASTNQEQIVCVGKRGYLLLYWSNAHKGSFNKNWTLTSTKIRVGFFQYSIIKIQACLVKKLMTCTLVLLLFLLKNW